MARHALGRPTAPARALAPAPSPPRRGVAALLLGATVAAGAATLVPGVAEAAPLPTTPSTTPARADLGVTVQAPSSVPANQAFVVTVTVTNNGLSPADRVRTTVALPAGMAAFAADGPFHDSGAGGTTYRFDEPMSLASGESRTYRVLAFAYRMRPISGSITATTRSTTVDPTLRNNTARAALAAAAYDGGAITGPIFNPPV